MFKMLGAGPIRKVILNCLVGVMTSMEVYKSRGFLQESDHRPEVQLV